MKILVLLIIILMIVSKQLLNNPLFINIIINIINKNYFVFNTTTN